MLRGKLKFNDPHVGVVEYTLFGRDSFNDTKLVLLNDAIDFTRYDNANLVFDKVVSPDGVVSNRFESGREVKNKDGLLECVPVEDRRRIDVKKTNKYKSNVSNRDLCLKVSALLRYMQLTCVKNYNQQGDVQFSTTREVVVDGVGVVKYTMGLITDLVCANSFVSIELHTVSDDSVTAAFDVAIFKELKERDKYNNLLSVAPIEIVGFKLSQDILGFKYVPQSQSDIKSVLGIFETIDEVIANNPDKNTVWIKGRHYEIVTDDSLEAVMQEFFDYSGVISFDTETSGLNINFKSRTNEADQLVGVVLCKEIGTGYYLPLQHKLFANLCDGDHWFFMEKYMKPLLEKKRIVCHGLSFDWKVAYIYGINVNCVYDTLIAFGVTKRYEEESFSMGLKSLVKTIFGLDMFELDDFVTGSSFGASGVAFWDLPYELVRQYAPADADMTLSLYAFLEQEDILNKYSAKRVFELELEFAKCVAYSEFYGYHIDIERIPDLRSKIDGLMAVHSARMFELAGREFNPRSAQQISKIMYSDMGIEPLGAKPSTDKETLKTLSGYSDADGEPKYPFVAELKAFRDNEGLSKNFLKRLHEFCTPDGFIFPEVMPLGTDTGRCSVRNPNYQSYNDVVKKCVVPRQGYFQFDCDFSQIEYRVLASEAKQADLIDKFKDPDMDYHTYQASRMFHVPYAAVSKTLRHQSKGINFGLPYGMGDSSLGVRIFGERSVENTAKAAELRRKFFQGQEKIQNYFEAVRSRGVREGYTATAFGRRRYYHKGSYTVSEIKRQAGNHVIQGTAADIYKLAIVRLFRRIVKEGWLGLVLLNAFVHDELVSEVHKSINPYHFLKAWSEEFQVEIEGYCPLFAGFGVGFSWYDAKKFDGPPQLAFELAKKYTDGMPWDENLKNFVDSVHLALVDYKVRRVKEYILDANNQGEVIKPKISTWLMELVDECVKKASGNATEVSRLNGILCSAGVVQLDGSHKIKNIKDGLKIYCAIYNVDYSSINILGPEEIDTTVVSGLSQVVVAEPIDFEDMSREDFAFQFTQSIGAYVDIENSVAYFSNSVGSNGVNILQYCFHKDYFTQDGEYAVKIFVNPADRSSLNSTSVRLTRENYKLIKEVYKTIYRGGGG